MTAPDVSFYLPNADRPPFDHLPKPDEMAAHPKVFLSPALNWIWRTYHHLASAGFACRLVETIPERGLIVTAACNLPLFFRPTDEQFIVSCVADSPPRFFAPCQLFQSATQAAVQSEFCGFPLNVHLPHWPQPGLLPRHESRKEAFQFIDYFGAEDQIAPELRTPAFKGKLHELGLELRFNFEHYHDYRTTDAVLAVRSFARGVINHKPASKLINAWLAGVPAILGPENAFRELRESESDYIEASDPDACLAACIRLRNDADLRRGMREQGIRRATGFSEASLTQQWVNLLSNILPSAQERWRRMSEVQRQLFFLERSTRRFGASAVRRIARHLPPG